MYQTLLYLHSAFRWLVLLSLIVAIVTAVQGLRTQRIFTRRDNLIRHWTATIAHIQLVLGMVLYTQSPVIRYFWKNKSEAIQNLDNTFFALIHLVLMLTAIVVITIGSALAKRRPTNEAAFCTMLVYYTAALVIILCAIPWPFSPLVSRPYFR